MKGVNNKSVRSAGVAGTGLEQSRKNQKSDQGKRKRQARLITASDLAAVNRRLDQCLPMETLEWQRVEQLLMQLSEFAPNALVYEAGMAAALYADEQARRAYLLGVEDGQGQSQAAEGNSRAQAGDAA